MSGLRVAFLARYRFASFSWFLNTLLGWNSAARFPGNWMTNLMGNCDALLMRDGMAISVGNFKTFLFWNGMTFRNWNLVRNWLTFSDRNGCAEFLGN